MAIPDDPTLTKTTGAGTTATPTECVSDWQTLYESDGEWVPPGLLYASGEVVFGGASDSPGGDLPMLALDVTDPQHPTRVVTGNARYQDLWLDADRVLYWQDDALYGVPIAGGDPHFLLNASSLLGDREIFNVVVTEDAVFWPQASADRVRTEVLRASRITPERGTVASFDDTSFGALRLGVSKTNIVADGSANMGAVAQSVSGGPARPLQPVRDAFMLGIDGTGVYYQRVDNRTTVGGHPDQNEILRAPADGSAPQTIRAGAIGEDLYALWSSGTGWLGIGRAYLDSSGPPRTVIVSIEASGVEHVLACSPGLANITSRPVLGDGSIFTITTAGGIWNVVQISLGTH